MTSVPEVLQELEYLKDDLVLHPLRVDSVLQSMMLLKQLVDIMAMTLRATIESGCLEPLKRTSNGDMI